MGASSTRPYCGNGAEPLQGGCASSAVAKWLVRARATHTMEVAAVVRLLARRPKSPLSRLLAHPLIVQSLRELEVHFKYACVSFLRQAHRCPGLDAKAMARTL